MTLCATLDRFGFGSGRIIGLDRRCACIHPLRSWMLKNCDFASKGLASVHPGEGTRPFLEKTSWEKQGFWACKATVLFTVRARVVV